MLSSVWRLRGGATAPATSCRGTGAIQPLQEIDVRLCAQQDSLRSPLASAIVHQIRVLDEQIDTSVMLLADSVGQVMALTTAEHLPTWRQIQLQDSSLAWDAVSQQRASQPESPASESAASGGNFHDILHLVLCRRTPVRNLIIQSQTHGNSGHFNHGVIHFAIAAACPLPLVLVLGPEGAIEDPGPAQQQQR